MTLVGSGAGTNGAELCHKTIANRNNYQQWLYSIYYSDLTKQYIFDILARTLMLTINVLSKLRGRIIVIKKRNNYFYCEPYNTKRFNSPKWTFNKRRRSISLYEARMTCIGCPTEKRKLSKYFIQDIQDKSYLSSTKCFKWSPCYVIGLR